MSKKTALKWFVEQLGLDTITVFDDVIQHALQMEREQIIEAANNGCKGMCMIDTSRDGKQYYNDTYGGQDER
jgi:hypothetical protein